MSYRPDFVLDDRAGWFRDTCYPFAYDMAGEVANVRITPPSSLDRLAVEVRNGAIYVNPREITPGTGSKPEGYEYQAGGGKADGDDLVLLLQALNAHIEVSPEEADIRVEVPLIKGDEGQDFVTTARTWELVLRTDQIERVPLVVTAQLPRGQRRSHSLMG